jgi:hypothetical protein
MKLTKQTLPSIAVAALLLTGSSYLMAQDEDDDIYELSPFTIEPEEGWIATETLAGTRLRTDFKDVAAQVEIFTMEFMEDFGITSMEESLIYSLNVANSEDRVSGNGEGFGRNPNNFQQIRGIGGGTQSRNFFEAYTPTENYNLSRLTIASGPQSILFGTGSPSGVLDVTLNRAELSEDFGSITFQTDSNGGHRVVLDYNKVIFEDKFALRIALVDKNTKQEWDPNHDKMEGYYGTFTWKPFENTIIMGHYEHQKRDWNRANRFLPFDNISPWFGWGQPTFDNSDVSWGDLPIIYDRGNTRPTILMNPDGSWQQPTTTFRNMAQVDRPVDMPGVSPVNFEADNWTLLDNSLFPRAMDVNIRGNTETQTMEADLYNIFIEQKLADNWYVELGYNKEDNDGVIYDTGLADRTLWVDPNKFLGDGQTPNPHLGEFYMQGTPQWAPRGNYRENFRGTMSYELNFEDKFDSILKWFGRHRMAALRSRDDRLTGLAQQGLRYRFLPDPNTLEEPYFANANFPDPTKGRRWAQSGNRNLQVRSYLNEETGYFSVSGRDHGLIFDRRPLTVTDDNGKSWTLDPLNTGYFNADGNMLVSSNAPQGVNTRLDSVQFGYQGFFWNDKIVTTFGWRKDKAKSKNFSNVYRDDSKGVSHPNGERGSGFYPFVEDAVFGDFNEGQSGITRTKGVVVRPLSWLSFHWNESDTFQPNIGRFDPYGTEYPGAEGEGEDIGFRLDLADNFSLRFNKFDLLSSPSRAANTPFNRWRDPLWHVATRYRDITGIDDYPNAGLGAFRERGRCCYWVMSDNLSEGTEITATYSPISGMDIRFTYTDREAIESNIGNIWFQWMEERKANSWTKFSVPEGGVGNPTDLNDNGVIDTWTWETAWINDNDDRTMAEYYQDITINGPIGAALIQALDGKPNEFDRTESANMNLNYRFQEGILQGWNAGFAVRYRGAPAVGFREIDINGVMSPDLDRIIKGAVDMTYDVTLGHRGKLTWFDDRNYTVRLNIRNVLDDGPLFPVIKSVDGNNIRLARKTGRFFILSFDVDI